MKRLIVANWKMNPQSVGEARKIASQIEHGLLAIKRETIEVAIAAPFIFLPMVKQAVHFVRLGSQNISAHSSGAYTGEVSAKQLLEFRVSLALVGHSERRALGETDDLINKKVLIALEHKIEPVLCVGFGTKFGMSESAEKKILMAQLRLGLRDVKVRSEKFAILYEPTWAISRGVGSGQAVAPSRAALMIKFIKSKYPQARVLYGGSIDSKTAAGFAVEDVIDGGVVGAASLRPQDFLEIVKSFNNY
ncbi:MAG: triose-phosphate isomerase [bacterium]|nr:triose-phosphate isomerase [bacterium]